MIITTTMTVDGYRVKEYRGVVRGLMVRAPTIMQGFLGGLKNIIGGKIGAFTKMCDQARQQAYDEMIAHAESMGANAIIGVSYDSSQIAADNVAATEVLCYGTAVIIEKI